MKRNILILLRRMSVIFEITVEVPQKKKKKLKSNNEITYLNHY